MPWKGLDEFLGLIDPTYRGPARPMWTPDDERGFQSFYGSLAKVLGLNPNPDDLGQMYDYRGAYQRQGGYPEVPSNVNLPTNPWYQGGRSTGGPSTTDLHWPSEMKYPEHPRHYINGYDTSTGGLAPMATNWIWEE